MSIAAIQNFALSFGVTGPDFNGVKNLNQILEKLNFSLVTRLLVKEGVYTPNNDYHWLWQNIPAAEAPNFIFIQTPTQLNVTITSPGVGPIVSAVPANKLFLLCLPIGVLVDNIYIEGRPIGAVPMVQGTEIQYFCLMAQAVF